MTMDWILDFARDHAYAGLFLVALVDALGVPFTGRLLLIGAGALAAARGLNLGGLTLAATLGALVGDHAWYLAGRYGGDRLLDVYCHLSRRRNRCVVRARDLIRRFGGLAFVIGRFVAGVKMLAAPVAPAAGIGYARFLVYDTGGALVWAGSFLLLGYLLGAHAPELMTRAGVAGAIAIGVVVTAICAVAVVIINRFSRSARGRPRPARGRRRRPAA